MSDEELAAIEAKADSMPTLEFAVAARVDVRTLIAEVRRLRTAYNGRVEEERNLRAALRLAEKEIARLRGIIDSVRREYASVDAHMDAGAVLRRARSLLPEK